MELEELAEAEAAEEMLRPGPVELDLMAAEEAAETEELEEPMVEVVVRLDITVALLELVELAELMGVKVETEEVLLD